VGNQTNATVWINGTRHLCTMVAADTNLDLAVLLVNDQHETFRPLRFAANTNYQMGQDVYTMGFPLVEILGTAPRLNKGLISSTVGMEDNPAQLQVSAQVQPGNSGGPLLNERGEVLGVTVATLNPMKVLIQSGGNLPQNINFAIKAGPVLEFLKRAEISLPADTNEASAAGFETAKTSLALVRSGNVTEEDLKQPTMVCACTYVSLWDMIYRFRAIRIDFYDVKKNDRIFRVGQYQEDVLSSEEDTLNRLFAEISANFFPDRPNPYQKR
jgi:serine protease Do